MREASVGSVPPQSEPDAQVQDRDHVSSQVDQTTHLVEDTRQFGDLPDPNNLLCVQNVDAVFLVRQLEANDL